MSRLTTSAQTTVTGPSNAGPSQADPSGAVPSGAGPSHAGPSHGGPSGPGPSDGGSSGAGPSQAGPSRTATPNTRPQPTDLHGPITSWYQANARDLPWRHPDASPWAVLVSEFMLQQTPVARVLPVYRAWLARWPTPATCAADSAGEAVRAWGRLGYPRRAIRLHAAAQACLERHGGAVPSSIDDLLALPGVGRYTAAAVASFAFGQRHAVLDTNVRRVHARAVTGSQSPAPTASAAEWQLAEALLPADTKAAAVWGVAVMELGALVCTARAPRCDDCPISSACTWRQAGRPEYDGPRRRSQPYDGTDRQCRGRILGVVRDADGPVARARLDAVWPDAAQRERAIGTLLADGLLEQVAPAAYRLPAGATPPDAVTTETVARR